MNKITRRSDDDLWNVRSKYQSDRTNRRFNFLILSKMKKISSYFIHFKDLCLYKHY